MSDATDRTRIVDATLPDEWVRCAKRGDKHALELLATAIDPSCDWRPEVRARALLVVWKRVQDPAAKESVRVALESLASANDALGVTIHKWAMTLSGEAHLLALNRADGAADRAEGKAASRLGSIALEEHDYPTAARWFRRAAESGCPGGYCGLYQLSQRDPSVVTREEGADALAAAVAAEDCVALVWQSLLHEDEGDDERAIYLADLAVAAARRDGVSSIRYALLAVRLRFGRNVLHGFMRTPTAPSGSAAQQLRDAIFSEFTNDYVLVRRAIVQLGYVLAHEGRAIPDELNERIVDLASHGYRPAITLARPLRIRFVCASNQLANLDHGPLPLDRTLNWMRDVCIELQTRLARDPVDADTFWNATRASQDLETVARLDKDVALLSLRAQLANALGRKIERDSLLEQWERLIETLPHWRQSEERERCLVARARYALFDRGPVPKIRVSPKSHPATLFYAATMLGAMGRTDYGKWVLGFLDEQDKEPAKTSLLRAEFEAQDGDPDEGDTLKCFDLIDDRSAKPIDRQRACRVFVDRASTAEMARRIPNLRSASAVSMLARSMLVAKRAPTPEVMTACAQHYFSRQHAEAYMDALVDLIRALLWASYCSCNRTDFLSLLACVGTAAHERASTGELHPGMVRKLITARPETWLRMFDAVSWSKALDAIDSALDRVGSGSAQDAKLIVRDMLDRQMDGVHWLLPKDMSGGFSDPSLPLRGSDAVNVLRNAAKSTLGSSHEIGTSGVPAAWFSVRATQRGVMRLQTHLDRLRTLLTNTRACEDYSIDLRLSERKVSLDLSLRLTAKGAPIAAMNLPAGVHGEPIRPGLLNCSITLISSFVSQPAHPRLHQWFTDRGHDTFREWWTSFASVDVWISEVLRALAWQCDHAWLLGHRPYVDLGPPARGALHRLRNRLRDRADDPSLLSWLRTQLHQLRREIVLGLFVSPPAFCVADLGAILTEVFRLEPPAPAVLVPVAPELLRDELLELSTNCRKYSIGDPRVSLEVDGSRCDVAIVNVKNAECGGTRYGLDLLRRRLQTAGIEVFVEDSEVIFTIRLRLRQHEICKGGGNDEAKH